VYDKTVGSLVTEYVCELPEQITVLPVILPGIAGRGLTETFIVCTAELPHALFAITEMVPPAAPGVTKILLLVLLPLQPPGRLHVYEMADKLFATTYVLLLPSHMVVLPEMFPGVEGEVMQVEYFAT
jgi:hypothetical protein